MARRLYLRHPQGLGRTSPGNEKPSEVFKRNFWITTSGVEHTPALKYSIDVLGADRILWAIDYPYQQHKPATQWLNGAEISDADKELIFHGNAERIFHIGGVRSSYLPFVMAGSSPAMTEG